MATATATTASSGQAFGLDPHHYAPTWRDHQDRVGGQGVNWGEGEPWRSRDMDLGKMLTMCDLPQDCSILACYLMRHGYEAGDVATIAKFKSPYRAEVWIGGIRYAVYDGSKIYTRELEA